MPDAGFVDHCLELLSPLGRARSRRMFGGHGMWVDDMCVALIIADTLYLKTDEANRPAFEAVGSRPFTYASRRGEVHVTSYFSAPDAAMESPAEMLPWGRRAVAAAIAARAGKPARTKKPVGASKAAAPGTATRQRKAAS